jgi:hypothetical protein
VNITLDIKCPELAEAINNLAAAMSIRSVDGALRDIVKPAAPKEDLHDPRHVGVGKSAKPVGKPKTTPATSETETATGDGETETSERSPASPSSGDVPVVDYTQVKAAVLKVSQEKGRAAAVELLGEFDAKVGGDLTEEQWGPFLARAAEVLG